MALLAQVGLSWYTWLEQGRDINISADALTRVAAALQLSPADKAYLFWLSGLPHADPPAFAGAVPEAVLATLRTYGGPAVVLDAMFDLLAANALAERLFRFERGIDPFPLNQLWQLFMAPERRALYVNYESDARRFAALFRLTSAPLIGNTRLRSMLDALLTQSRLFNEIWNRQETSSLAPQVCSMEHPDFGRIDVLSLRLPLPATEGGCVIFLAPATEATATTFARVVRQLDGSLSL